MRTQRLEPQPQLANELLHLTQHGEEIHTDKPWTCAPLGAASLRGGLCVWERERERVTLLLFIGVSCSLVGDSYPIQCLNHHRLDSVGWPLGAALPGRGGPSAVEGRKRRESQRRERETTWEVCTYVLVRWSAVVLKTFPGS